MIVIYIVKKRAMIALQTASMRKNRKYWLATHFSCDRERLVDRHVTATRKEAPEHAGRLMNSLVLHSLLHTSSGNDATRKQHKQPYTTVR